MSGETDRLIYPSEFGMVPARDGAKEGYAAVRGMTVITRENGRITRESLFHDVAELQRQLT